MERKNRRKQMNGLHEKGKGSRKRARGGSANIPDMRPERKRVESEGVSIRESGGREGKI